jgi:valyl-tRNA synthetase
MSTPTTGAPRVPDKPTLDNLEERWAPAWEEAGTYRFDDTATRAEVFSIDTPPPTVSGSLHMGSVFGYVQTDAIARYRRMRGWKLFYPMGWDDNGLPTERRVQTYFGVTCDPSLPYDPDFTPPDEPGKDDIPVSRPNFIALCHQLTVEDERAFEDLWRRVGLSVDWGRTYATIDDKSRRASQRMFLHNLARGEAYTSEAPTLWDVDFQTAVAQAEMEDRQLAPTTAFASTTSRSRRRAPSWWPPVWPWSPTPTTSATPPGSVRRCTRRSSGSRCPSWPIPWPNPTRDRVSP